MARELEHRLLVETFESLRRGAQQRVVDDEVGQLLLGDGSEPESVGEPARQRAGVAAFTRGGEHERGERRLLRVAQPLERGRRARVVGDQLAQPLDELEAQHVRRVEEERIGAAFADCLRELGQRPFEHLGCLEEPPRADAALAEQREEP